MSHIHTPDPTPSSDTLPPSPPEGLARLFRGLRIAGTMLTAAVTVALLVATIVVVLAALLA